ncbi:MAG: lipocalin family protein [Gemmatimonadaceae bacterium]
MRRIFVTVCTLAIALLTGCGTDYGTAPTQASLAGTWNLTTVNGAPLPFIIQAANPKLEVLSDQYILLANGTFTETYQLRGTVGTDVSTQTFTDAGTYSVTGTAVNVRYSDGTGLTGTVSGNTVTIAQSGASLVFTKQ